MLRLSTGTYTFSKSIDDGAVQGNVGTFSGNGVILNPQNIKQENGLSELNQTHRFAVSVVWDPFRNIRGALTRLLLRGLAGGRAPQFGRNVFVGPGLHNIDFRVLRVFSPRAP